MKYQVYYANKLQSIVEVSESDFMELVEFYHLTMRKGIWTNKKGDVFAWRKGSGITIKDIGGKDGDRID